MCSFEHRHHHNR